MSILDGRLSNLDHHDGQKEASWPENGLLIKLAINSILVTGDS